MRKISLLRTLALLWAVAGVAQAVRADDVAVVDSFDERPVPVKAIPPTYPPDMLQQEVSGLVNVVVIIDASGNVVERAVAKSTRPEFERPALEAVKKWKFKPAKKAGTAVAVKIVVPISFKYDS